MKVYRRFLHILKQRGEQLILFEITVRAMGILIGAFVSLSVPYIVSLNLQSLSGPVTFDPITIFFLCSFTIGVSALVYLSLIEIIGLCHIAHSSDEASQPSVIATMRFSAKKALHILHAYGLTAVLVIFIGVLIFPILNINPELFQTFALPISLYREHGELEIWASVRILIYASLLYIAFRSIFTFHIFASREHSLFLSLKESWRHTKLYKKSHELLTWGVMVPVLLTTGLFLASIIVFLVGIGMVNALIGLLFSVFPQGVSIMLYASWIYVMTVMLALLVAPVSVTALCAYMEIRMPDVLGKDSAQQFEHISRMHFGWKLLRNKKNIILLGLLAFILFAVVARKNMYILQPSPVPPSIIAHRGIGEKENSVQAFEMAIQAGAHGIETDIQMLSDGELVLFHDETLSRLYGSPDILRSLNQSELLKRGYDIESFDTLLNFMEQTVKTQSRNGETCTLWLLEIKAYPGTQAVVEIGNKMYAKLKEKDLLDCAYIGSFDQRAIIDLETMYPDLKTNMYLLDSPLYPTQISGVDAFAIEQTIIEDLIPELPEGADIFAWTVNTYTDIRRVILLGVKGVVTHRLDIANLYLAEGFPSDVSEKRVVYIFGKWFAFDLQSLWKFDIRYSL